MSNHSGKSSGWYNVLALALAVGGVAIGALGVYIGDTDDAPGAALIGLLLMVGLVASGVRFAWLSRKTRIED